MHKKLRTIIVDDEKEARTGLDAILSTRSDLEVVALCENGLEAIKEIHRLKPELVFLDIQMPEIDGFEVLNSLAKEYRPIVVFTTAYDQYALEAFRNHALDYILKPVTPKKVDQFLSHLAQLPKKMVGSAFMLANDFGQHKEPQILKSQPELERRKLIFKSMGKIHFLDFDDIQCVEADGVYVNFVTMAKKYLVRDSLKRIEERLPTKDFLRVNKSQIINLGTIHLVDPYFNGEYYISTTYGGKIKVSRGYAKRFARWLDQGII